jgi:hypothetical protein
MKRTSALAMILGSAVCFLLPLNAHAITAVAESFEWVLARSDRVVIGKVVKVEDVTGADEEKYQAVTIAISRTLKGAHRDRETFLLHRYISRSYATQWKEEGIPTLFCLVKNDGQQLPFPGDKFAWILREDHNHADAVLLDRSKHYWSGSIPVLTREFEVLTEKEAILQFVEKTLKTMAKGDPQCSHALRVPGGTAVCKKLYSGSAVYLVVPVDEKLEILGRKWCKSTSSFDRREGSQILGHFKNETNIELLRSLLGDPTTSEETKHRTVPGKSELELVYRKKRYPVRQAAFDALGALGVRVDKPVLEELLEGRDDSGAKPAEGMR